ncbi:MAG TPA: ABC transporter ATP-binding protein [Candidatus Acidoferrales bacterium]|nr:ABC transporter ATP-binding protein [Candidatus Acidoferrales bacterium]
MTDIAIRVEGIGKVYRVGERERYRALRDVLAGAFRGSRNSKHRPKDTIWAVRDVSFEVHRGEVVGLIGRNGAGKSTLLKLLARITRPTVGRAQIHGRIGSLLEVGTGFHPELTGRENIFLSGAILGMKKAEILRKFDEIVAFAEVERFLDSPLKHYSSGMQMRLAFAVAAHLEPEILLVDEVLAVGDLQFQKKCLGKMQDVSRTGRTIIFVSHNMGAVRMLCETGYLLRSGFVAMSGPIETLISAYSEDGLQCAHSDTVTLPKAPDRCPVWMESVSILGNGRPTTTIETGDEVSLEVKFRAREPIERPIVGFLVRSSRGENVVSANNYYLPSGSYQEPVTEGAIVCDLGDIPLMAGSYSVSFWLCRNPMEQHHVEDVLRFSVEEKDIWGNGALPNRNVSPLWWPTRFRFTEKQRTLTGKHIS